MFHWRSDYLNGDIRQNQGSFLPFPYSNSLKRVIHSPETASVPLYRLVCRDFLLPVAALLALDFLVLVPLVRERLVPLAIGIALVILPKLVAVPWTGARLLRIAERHHRRHGTGGVRMALLGALLAAVLGLLVSTIEAIQTMIFTRSEQGKVWTAPTLKYRFGFDRDTGRYTIDGEIDFGISRDFRAFLAENPGGKTLVLDSPGGSVYEGRGLLRIVSGRGLDTHVEKECLSACVLAFLGGKRRTLAADAGLGFHQYAVDYSNLKQAIPFYDPEREQAHDIALMREIGISEAFLERAFHRPHDGIWMPPHDVLAEAGILRAGP